MAFIFTIMDNRYSRKSASDILRNITIIASVASVTFNCTVLIISVAKGQWIFGDACCQIFALLSQVLVAGNTWMVALWAIERCYLYNFVNKHPSTFSEINIRVMVYGLYLLLLVLHTGPLYGWGEYSFYRGGLELGVDLADGLRPNSTSITSANYIVLSGPGNMSCSDAHDTGTHVNTLPLTSPALYDVIQRFIQREYQCDVRVTVRTVVTFVLRFTSTSHLDSFATSFRGGQLAKKLHVILLEKFDACNSSIPSVGIHLTVNHDKLNQYRHVDLQFQDIGICSLDFSSIDSIVCSWIPFVVITSAVLPYGMAFLCGCLLLRSSTAETRRDNNNSAAGVVICSVIGFLATVPYYYINIANHNVMYIDFVVNIASTVLYYCNCVLYLAATGSVVCVCRVWTSRRDVHRHNTAPYHGNNHFDKAESRFIQLSEVTANSVSDDPV